MNFNSLEFIAFLTATITIFNCSPRRFRQHVLLAASLYFYAAWNSAYLILLAFVVLTSYLTGLLMAARPGRLILFGSIACSLGVLSVFKYGDFAIGNINMALRVLAEDMVIDDLRFLLPVGISFYTFQAMAYVVDVYKRKTPYERNLVSYALYITFFPQLVAGPIERPAHILPQIKNNLECLPQNIMPAFTLILSGFFRKLVIADRLGIFVDATHRTPGQFPPEQLLLAMYFFAFQIYCDFSGYTNIARGVARLFNIELMENFDRPYFATSIQDFWKRWHISLSTWFRDYLYIPLGGSRRGDARTLINIFIVFALCGLWHGAAYTFITWGVLHGALLMTQNVFSGYSRLHLPALRFPHPLMVFVTFHLVCLLWIFFRADTLKKAVVYILKLAHVPSWAVLDRLIFANYENFLSVLLIVALVLLESTSLRLESLETRRRKMIGVCIHTALLFSILALGVFDNTTFIYFQF